jgi:hypothetical protein
MSARIALNPWTSRISPVAYATLSAKVNTIEALQAFREVLATFGEETKHALGAIEMELRRAQDWLEHDQPMYWRQVVRRCDREMNDARSALHKKDLQRTHGYIPDTSEEKEILRRARQRMYDAEKTLQAIRRWGPAPRWRARHAVPRTSRLIGGGPSRSETSRWATCRPGARAPAG